VIPRVGCLGEYAAVRCDLLLAWACRALRSRLLSDDDSSGGGSGSGDGGSHVVVVVHALTGRDYIRHPSRLRVDERKSQPGSEEDASRCFRAGTVLVLWQISPLAGNVGLGRGRVVAQANNQAQASPRCAPPFPSFLTPCIAYSFAAQPRRPVELEGLLGNKRRG